MTMQNQQQKPMPKPIYKSSYAIKNDSIEAQVVDKSITDREIAGLKIPEDLIKLRDDWERRVFKKAL